MTKINFSTARSLAIIGIVTVLVFSGRLKAQNSFFLQKAFQSCLDHSTVQPHLRAVSFDENKEVLVIEKNKLTSSNIKIAMFGKDARILADPELFFYDLHDYVSIIEVKIKKNKITLTFTSDAQFTCTYSTKKNKVKNVGMTESQE